MHTNDGNLRSLEVYLQNGMGLNDPSQVTVYLGLRVCCNYRGKTPAVSLSLSHGGRRTEEDGI